MKTLREYLKETYQLSSYQLAQVTFLFKMIFSELSKILIMGVIFRSHMPSYLLALAVMLFLRCSTGGMHFYTYIGCLASSIGYMWLAIVILPHIMLPKFLQLLFLLACILVCYYVGPVISKYRPLPSEELFTRGRNITCTFIFIFALIQYIMPGHYLNVGFWVIILHSLQLTMAKIQKKGAYIE